MGSQPFYPRLKALKRAPINFNSSGDNTIISADTDHRIMVHRLWFVVGGATNITFKDNLASPAAIPMAANGALVFDVTGEPWFQTDKDQAFIINQSGTEQVSGCCDYSLEP